MVTPPQDPEEEPVGDELPDERPREGPEEGPSPAAAGGSDGLSAEDALWKSIVDNYGERPKIEEVTVDDPPAPSDRIEADDPVEDDSGDTIGEAVPADPEEHFVPPPPPPLPKPPPARLLAWFGLFGVPAIVLVALVLGFSPPSWLGLLLMGWFVGGFVFLVASMKPGSGDGGDDGARI